MKLDHYTIEYRRFHSTGWEKIIGGVAVETPVTLMVNGETWLTFMCTPNNLDALAVGFLFNEGVIGERREVVDIRICSSGAVVDVWLHGSVEEPKVWKRTSGCTGGYTAVDEHSLSPLNNDDASLTALNVNELVEKLFGSQELYRKVGGVHTSVLSDSLDVNIMAEDIGRHNSLDKLAGRLLLEDIQFSNKILLTTGRISSDMLQKSARIGASIVISRTSPSSLSIELAEKWGITLIGYARRNRFNVYTHPNRIVDTQSIEVKNA
jgi:FdhD protein